MTLLELQDLLKHEASFKRIFLKECTILKDQFNPGKLPCIHQATLPDGSVVRLKFYDVVKKIFNNQAIEIPGKESFLCYLNITCLPLGLKAYSYSCELNQTVWGTAKISAQLKHDKKLLALKDIAASLGIDLSESTAWYKIYTENI